MKVLIFAAFFQGATSMCWAQQTGSTDEYHRGYLWAHMHHVDNTSTCDGVVIPPLLADAKSGAKRPRPISAWV